MGILDIFFPKRCVVCGTFGEYLCPSCFSYISFTSSSICGVCNRASLDGQTHPLCKGKYTVDGILASLSYTGVVKKLIYVYKYKPYLSSLHDTLTDLFYEGVIQKELFHKALQRESVFVPIPLHQDRFRSRGYNHAGLLSRDLSKRFKLPVRDLLVRQKKTLTQAGLSRKDRMENLRGAFGLKGKIKSVNVFLVDDIVTSGATFLEAAKVLKKAGAKCVWGLALAANH